MKPGDTYFLPYCNQTITLVRIIDREGGKKLTETLYEWEHVDDTRNKFKNKWGDINTMLNFKMWIKVNENNRRNKR